MDVIAEATPGSHSVAHAGDTLASTGLLSLGLGFTRALFAQKPRNKNSLQEASPSAVVFHLLFLLTYLCLL